MPIVFTTKPASAPVITAPPKDKIKSKVDPPFVSSDLIMPDVEKEGFSLDEFLEGKKKPNVRKELIEHLEGLILKLQSQD